MMPRHVEQLLAGWGNLRPERCHVYRPEKRADLRALVTAGGVADKGSLIARGLGRSYGDSAVNAAPGGVALLTRMDRLLDFDPASGVLEAEGGVSLAALVDVFLPRGFFLPVTPGTKFVTLGGAIAADVHGKNHHADGTIGNFIEGIRLMVAGGDVLTCSRDTNPDVFWATVGGMGLTGIVLSARLRLLPVTSAYVRVDYRRAANLDAALDHFESARGREPKYSVAWIDCLAGGDALGRSVVMEGDHLSEAELPEAVRRRGDPLRPMPRRKRSVPFHFPAFALSRPTVRLFNKAFHARHGDRTHVVDADTFFYPLDAVYHWNRIYGRRGFVQYQALLPPPAALRGLRALLGAISKSGNASFLAVLKRTGPQGAGMFSFPTDGYTLALDLPNTGRRMTELVRTLDEILLRHAGRLYLAKDGLMTADTFAAMYPRLGEFQAVKAKVDPQNVFHSSQARRLRIVG